MNPKYYEYTGILHIHSRYSDGSGTIKQIVRDAQKSNLDYIIITDHNSIQAMKDGAEGWHGDLLVLVGEEIGAKRSSHYLALGINELIDPKAYQGDVLKFIEAVKHQGGIGFVPHPILIQNKSFDLRISPWDAWENKDYTGIEIWSYMYDWSENVTLFNILYYYFHPEKAIDGPPLELLQKWDQLCQTRQVTGIGTADVHARYPFFFNFIKFLSYKRVFQGVRTHLLTKSPLSSDLNESKKLVYTALASGHCFFSHDSLTNSEGFNFEAFTDDGKVLLMGDEIKLINSVTLKITSPVPADIILFRDGHQIKNGSTQLTLKTSERGVYRVEARYNGKPWVYTNPIYIR